MFLSLPDASIVLDSPPKLKDLYNIVTPEYAAHWKVIGILLDISKGYLDGIEKSYPTNTFWCCNKMLESWLEMDTSATWRKLIQIIDSPAVVGANASMHMPYGIFPSKGNILNFCGTQAVFAFCVV